uniref:G-protein-signaling modulator 2 n=1 Tax=Fundulus heteroclitus TaxID=8078 RepID=A0A3Q2PHW7_FUNHE
AGGSTTSDAPSGWRGASPGGGATRSPTPGNRHTEVGAFVFSSMTSLQKEEFFDLVATAQARRLDDQRAHLKQLSLMKKPEPVPAPKEDLYDMILTTQAQGRLEDQRSRAPGPMDDEDFFSLLLRVQGGRMDEQRTELPRLLKT